MFKIEGKTLYLTRGDTAYLEIDVNIEREIKEITEREHYVRIYGKCLAERG